MGKAMEKRTARAIREGKQSTLKPCPRQPLPRLPTAAEAQLLFHAALAEIWGIPAENIRSRSWAMPVITYYK